MGIAPSTSKLIKFSHRDFLPTSKLEELTSENYMKKIILGIIWKLYKFYSYNFLPRIKIETAKDHLKEENL